MLLPGSLLTRIRPNRLPRNSTPPHRRGAARGGTDLPHERAGSVVVLAQGEAHRRARGSGGQRGGEAREGSGG